MKSKKVGDNTMTELKQYPKCPFCGREASIYVTDDDGYYVCSDECGCCLPVYNTEEDAIREWNRRVSEVAENEMPNV